MFLRTCKLSRPPGLRSQPRQKARQTTMIEIRPAAPQDVPEILAIQTSVFQDAAWRAEDYRRMLDDAESLVLVAQDRDSQELVGYAAARSACGQAELLHLAVKPSRQRS